ncbi:MFS transporter [Marinomonas spartinae]|uniref:MFS transporter n=1 Tax=Marinomonas spartinae TaxID=1792290 RepID=UPI0018F16ACA|nr:MFS transporter [Marinomonas spartinae]MBJ7556937.1 MFS transporter [Marinomonas spartinae]
MIPIPYFILLAMCSPIALNAILPALPDIAQQLGIDSSTVQLNYSLYLAALALGQLSVGAVIARLGNRSTILLGISFFVVGGLIALVTEHLFFMLLGRILQGIGGAFTLSMSRALLVASSGGKLASQKMGYVVMAIALSQGIGPLIGSSLNTHIGWQAIFAFSAIQGAILLLLSLKLIKPEPQRPSKLPLKMMLSHYMSLIRQPAFNRYAMANTLIALCFYLFISASPYLTKDLSKNSLAYGYWFMLVSGAFMLGGYLSTLLNRRLSLDKSILVGNSFCILGAVALLVLQISLPMSFATLFLPMSIITLGRGISQPSYQSAAIGTANKLSGMAAGLLGFLQLSFGAIFAQIVPLMIDLHPHTIAFAILACTLLATATHRNIQTMK